MKPNPAYVAAIQDSVQAAPKLDVPKFPPQA